MGVRLGMTDINYLRSHLPNVVPAAKTVYGFLKRESLLPASPLSPRTNGWHCSATTSPMRRIFRCRNRKNRH